MNSLWTSLIALIVIAIAIVVAFNLLQGRQSRLRDAWRGKLAAGRPPAEPKPVPAPTDSGQTVASAQPTAPNTRVEPTLGPPPSSPQTPDPDDDLPMTLEPAAAVVVDPLRAGPVLDPRLDCLMALTPAAPIAVERLLASASTVRRAGSKPIAIEIHAGDGRWAVPTAAAGVVAGVRAGVLLANRHGPLNAMEFSEFAQAMQSLARAVGADDPGLPAMAPVLDHARQLDEACARLDAVIGLNVETTAALSPAELAELASGLGLDERGNNRYAWIGPEGEVVFSLALGDRAEQLTLLLDVPRAPQGLQPWARMVDCAGLCAERTGGRVIDDAGRPMTEAAVQEVGRQLDSRYRSLRDAGLDAGSPAALRIFN